jgi:hypothetical protein
MAANDQRRSSPPAPATHGDRTARPPVIALEARQLDRIDRGMSVACMGYAGKR